MATINGSTNTSVWTFKLVTTEGTANVANNTSPLTVAVYLGRSSSGGGSYMWGASISCPIDVTGCTRQTLTYSNSGQVNVAAGAWLLLGSKTFTVPHNADGKKTVTVSASFTSNVSPASGSAKGDVTLATIPRATTPTLSATSVTMGSSITITMSPADSTFKHKLRYEFGTLTGQTSGLSAGTSNYTAAGNTTATFTPPVALGSQIPTANSGTCKILCYTYTSGGTHIGTKELNVTLNVPSYSPTISSVALTGNNLRDGVYVQGKSTVTVTTTASSSYGAGIASYSCTVDGVKYATKSFTTAALKSATTYTITVTVTDGRGKSASKPATAFTVYEYKAPYITSFTAVRQADGTTVVATLVGGVSSLNSKNGKAFTVTLNGQTMNVSSSGFTVNGSVTFTGIDTDSTFVATASVADYYTSATMPVVVPTEAVTMDFHYSGKGAAFGKVAEHEGVLDIAWDIKHKGNLVKDFVVNQGTSGIWTYRIWESGMAECWGKYTAEGINASQKNYTGFYYSNEISVTLPIEFSQITNYQVDGGSMDRINFARMFGAYPASNAVRFIICGHQADATSVKIEVYLSVIGKVK